MRQGLSNHLKTQAHAIMTGRTQQNRPGSPIPLTYFLPYYCLWTHGRPNFSHAADVEQVTPQRELQQVWITRQKQGMYQINVAETLNNILKESLQVWHEREIPTSQGILTLTQVGFTKSTGGQQEAKYQNIADPQREIQVQSPGRTQMSHQLYQPQRILVKSGLTQQY